MIIVSSKFPLAEFVNSRTPIKVSEICTTPFCEIFQIKKLQFAQTSQAADIALRKRHLNKYTAKDVRQKNLDSIVQTDKGYSFLATQRLSPANLKRLEKNYLAWVGQLGNPAFSIIFTMLEAH